MIRTLKSYPTYRGSGVKGLGEIPTHLISDMVAGKVNMRGVGLGEMPELEKIPRAEKIRKTWNKLMGRELVLRDASVPGQYPTQDGVYRSPHVAIIVQLNIELEYAYLPDLNDVAIHRASNELRRLLPRMVNETIAELFPMKEFPGFDTQEYHVGSMAGGIADLAHIIVTLAERSDMLADYLDDVPTYYFFYRAAIEVKRRIADWTKRKRIPGLHATHGYTPEDLKLLAEGYTYELLDSEPAGRTAVHCLSEEFYGGYQSPAHPGGILEHLIVVPTKAGSFRFRTMGDSRILELVADDGTGEHRIEALEYLDG